MRIRASHLVMLLCIAASLAARTLADALHIPGFYDTLGLYLAGLTLPLGRALAAGVAAYLALTLYYRAYLLLLWVPLLLVPLAKLLWRRLGAAAGIPLALVYTSSLFATYAAVSHTWGYAWLFPRTRGFIVYTLDSLAMFELAYVLRRRVELLVSRGSAKTLAAAILVLLLVAGASWAKTLQEASVYAGVFHEMPGWHLERLHKMDFVWLPLGEKGYNTSYYPRDRFERGSPGYQVWLGMYWVEGRHDIRDVSLVSEFAVWDQNFWLGLHGCPRPYTYVDRVYNVTKVVFAGHPAYLMYGGMVTRSDVPPYEEVRLRGFFITFYDPRTDRTAIIYACSTAENVAKMLPVLRRIVAAWNSTAG